ncbi:phosphatidate cytidylyltransferase [Desulfoluna sp.]|uniref:phosphatidate cytidylyltransferase n=1 Tax=Desulfoluna sp. TaxID=2045199 RepID=UPI00260E2089|nr:phosphatidate cytidylyltransferase [Desulfoluna sp.]
MHVKRILSAVVAIPLLWLFILKGGPVFFTLLMMAVAVIALTEYYPLVDETVDRLGPLPLLGYASAIMMVGLAHVISNPWGVLLGVVFLNIPLGGFLLLPRFETEPKVLRHLFTHVFGLLYIPMALASVVRLRIVPDHGILWIFTLLVTVAACDTGAFYAGTFLGKRKLCPSVSPGKTVEGFLGGMAAALVAGFVMKGFFVPELSWLFCLLLFPLVGVFGPLGDLFESSMKRASGIKDSGHLIPGHGGLLDRIDAFLFVAPLFYFFMIVSA